MIPPALHDEVRRPQDAALGERAVERVGGELVVGGAGDRPAAQRGTVSSLRTPPSAHGATTSTSAVSARPRVGPGRAQALGQLALALVDVGEDELRAALVQQFGQPPADRAERRSRRSGGRSVVGAEGALAGDADARPRSRARSTGSGRRSRREREPGDVPGAAGDHLHVAARRSRRPRRSGSRRRAPPRCRRSPAAPPRGAPA